MKLPILSPLVLKTLRFASSLVKDEKLPVRGDGPLQLLAKGLSIADAIQSEFGAGDDETIRFKKEGLVEMSSEAFVSFFFESKLRSLFDTNQKSLGKRYDSVDARSGAKRVVFLKRQGTNEYDERMYVPPNFDLGELREDLWSLYPHGLLLSATQDRWMTKPVFLEVQPPEEDLLTSVMRERVANLVVACNEPEGPRSFLFLGPAGTGKTVTVQMLAQRLKCSLLRVDASVLREIGLKEMEFLLRFFSPGVLAVEDFDRVPEGNGCARLLLLLERIRQVSPKTLVVLTANDATKIDYAALRGERIDEIVDFDFPTMEEIREILNLTDTSEALDLPQLCHANLVRVAKVKRNGGDVARVLRVMTRLQALSEESAKADKGPTEKAPS